jgi:predicted enzyme related to lactoylglutathione lyase
MATPQLVLVLDSVDPAALAPFWAQVLHYRRHEAVEQYEVLQPPEGVAGPMLLIQGVAEPKAGKNRMHLDVHVDDVAAEVERLVALGATRVGDGAIGDSVTWVRMLDPEGNEFDLAAG